MDKNFNEVVKVSKENNTTSLKNKEYVKIWDIKEKINKQHRDYFKYFKNLKKDELGISFMDNNIEFGHIEPKPVIRLAHKLYHEKEPIGYVIVNIALEEFLHSFVNTTLYDIWIIDKDGNLLLNSNPEYQILGQVDITKYRKIQELYPFNCLNNKYNFLDSHTLAVSLDGFNKAQGLYMVLHTKYGHHLLNNWEKLVLLTIIVLFLLSLIASYVFGKGINKLSDSYLHNLLFDQETNLPNKIHLLEDLSKNSNQVVALITIDNIKQLTAVYGVDLTDKVIKQFANSLTTQIETLGFTKLHRVEYALFAMTYTFDNNYANFKDAVQNLHKLIEEEEFICGEKCTTHFSVTVGGSDPYHIHDGKNELQEATLALEKAMMRKTSFEIYNINDHFPKKNTENVLHWINIIKKALKENLVTPYAQVIVDTGGKPKKYEALIRINYNEHVYAPYHFMDIAKVSRYYFSLSRLMIENVFKAMYEREYECSINISTFDISDENFTTYLIELMNKYNLGNRLTIEILESEHLPEVESLKEFLRVIKLHNVKVAIDDFGAGHSNLERVLNLAEYIDYLKIDGSLIKNILTDKKSQVLVKNIINFSKELEFETIAEFVENEKSFLYLKELGVDYFQGYYFGQPEPLKGLFEETV